MRRKMRRIVQFLCFMVILAVLLLGLFRSRYYKPIQFLAQAEVASATSDLINESIARQIASGNIQYDRIVYFEKDLNGRITALKTNMSEVNRLKTDILEIVNNEIVALDSRDLGIPIGSLFFPEFFSGRGANIPVYIITTRNSDAGFESSFSAAGINQTLHQIIMNISIEVSILTLGCPDSFTVTSQVVVAETIIVGEVPDTLFQTGG